MIRCDYVVAEDNAGGLFLFIVDGNGEIAHAYGNFEYDPGSLTEALHELEDDSEAYMHWENDMCDFHDVDVLAFCEDNSLQVIKHCGVTWVDRMGAAARIEFAITEIECSSIYVADKDVYISCTNIRWISEEGRIIMYEGYKCIAILDVSESITFTLLIGYSIRSYRIDGGICFELI